MLEKMGKKKKTYEWKVMTTNQPWEENNHPGSIRNSIIYDFWSKKKTSPRMNINQ